MEPAEIGEGTIYGDISTNRHIAAYGKGANILPLLCMRAKPQRVT